MNKKIIIAVVVIILAAGGWYFFGRGGASVGTGTGSPSAMQSLKDLMLAGRPVKCTFEASEATGNSSGTTYIQGQKMRGDFSTSVKGKMMASHMIVDGNTSYIWTDGETKGFKTTVTDEDKAKANINTGSVADEGEIGLEDKADYHCEGWSVDSSVFRLPNGVTFTDLSEMMKGFGAGAAPNVNAGAGAGSNSSQCAACDSAGEYRDQCRAALGCK